MLIMLEGLDRTGKTTLGNAIAKRLDSPVIHKGQPKHDWYLEYVAPLAGYGPGLDLVLDRWHWGEMVWPTVFDREATLPLLGFRYIERVLTRLGGVAVLGTGNRDQLWQDAVNGDEPIAAAGPGAFDNAHRLFSKVAALSTVPVYEYDYRAVSLETAATDVLAMAHSAQRAAAFNAVGELERLMEIEAHPVA